MNSQGAHKIDHNKTLYRYKAPVGGTVRLYVGQPPWGWQRCRVRRPSLSQVAEASQVAAVSLYQTSTKFDEYRRRFIFAHISANKDLYKDPNVTVSKL